MAGSLASASGCDGQPEPFPELGGRVDMGPWPARPGATRMSIWCRASSPLVSEVELRRVADGETSHAGFEALGEGVFLATFEGLSPDTEYAFHVPWNGGIDTGSFRTLPLADGLLRFAVSADIHRGSLPYVAFDALRERRPHLYLGLGDQVYADLDPGGARPRTDADFDALYRANWDDASLVACWQNVPTMLMWDDHEIWNDYDGSFEAFAAPATRAYERFQRSRSAGETAWSIIDLGPASMFVLDTRSFRSPNAAADGPGKTMLGDAQRNALLAWIATEPAAYRIIASPTPFHPHADTGKDAWAHGFAYERGLILQAIADAGPEGFILVSGDQHWPAVLTNALPGGGTVREFQCTPIAAFRRTPPIAPSPDFSYVGDGSVGFGEFVIDATVTPPTLRFAWIDAEGVERYVLEA